MGRRRGAAWLAAALSAAALACSAGAPEGGGGGREDGAPPAAIDPHAGPVSSWVAEWTLLVFAANDVRDPALVAAFERDALEWQRGLGGSALFRILVERDFAPSQAGPDGAPNRPSERYGIYREQRFDPSSPTPEDIEEGAHGAMALGETDTADPATLERFLVDGIRRFPAKHYWVVITGHGDGWNGLADDATSGPDRRLSIAGLRRALRAGADAIEQDIRRRPGLGGPGTSDRFDVVQFDVCRLGAVEVAASLEDVADTMVASQEAMPDAGHPYSALRSIAQDHLGVAPRVLVEEVVTDYVRSYVPGVSTQDRAYVGTSVTSVGLDLRRMRPLVDALGRLRSAVRAHRPTGFTCAEVQALAQQAAGRAGIVRERGRPAALRAAPGGATPASRTALDLIALLEALSDPARLGPGAALAPRVSLGTAITARAALSVIGRPHFWTPAEPSGNALLYGGQYREMVSFNPDGPFIVEAQRVDPGTATRTRGLSVLWGDPLDLLVEGDAGAPLDVYRRLPFETMTGWTDIFEACLKQAQACLSWTPDLARPGAPSPCAGLGVD